MHRLIQRIELADDVQRAVAESEDINEAYQVLEAAATFYNEHGRPMTMTDYEQIKFTSVGG